MSEYERGRRDGLLLGRLAAIDAIQSRMVLSADQYKIWRAYRTEIEQRLAPLDAPAFLSGLGDETVAEFDAQELAATSGTPAPLCPHCGILATGMNSNPDECLHKPLAATSGTPAPATTPTPAESYAVGPAELWLADISLRCPKCASPALTSNNKREHRCLHCLTKCTDETALPSVRSLIDKAVENALAQAAAPATYERGRRDEAILWREAIFTGTSADLMAWIKKRWAELEAAPADETLPAGALNGKSLLGNSGESWASGAQGLREALELIANGEWVTDSSAQELARTALAAARRGS